MTNSSDIINPGWPESRGRWTAFWERESTDRPCLWVTAPISGAAKFETLPDTTEAHHLDPEYIARCISHFIEWTYFGGEAFPCSHFFGGCYTLGCGDEVAFGSGILFFGAYARIPH